MHLRIRFATLLAAPLLACLPVASGQRNSSLDSAKPIAGLHRLAQPETQDPASAPVSTVAGNGFDAGTGTGGYSGDNGPATSAELNHPQGIAFDSSGNLFIADSANNRIRRVDGATGIITTVAGGGSCASVPYNTVYTYCGDGGAATSAGLDHPSGIAIDSAGNLFIADTLNDAIRKVDGHTGIITSYVGSPMCGPYLGITGEPTVCTGQAGYTGDGGAATSAQLNSPYDVILDSAGNLYIADGNNNVVRKVTAAGIITTSVGGGLGCAGQTDSLGDGCLAANAILSGPTGLSFDGLGNLYIADAGYLPNYIISVRKVDAATGIISTIAGGGSGCTEESDGAGDGCPGIDATFIAEAGFYNTAAVPDANGNVYLSNPLGQAIHRVDSQTGIITLAVGTYFTHGFTGVTASTAELYDPDGLVFDALGNLYIADTFNNVIRKVTYNTTPVTAAPTFSPTPGTYSSTQSVMLSDATGSSTIYYTLDGTTPTTSSFEYGGAIAVSETTTIKAIAVATGFSQSAVATATYTIATPAAPTVTTGASSTVTSSGASAAGTVNPNGADTKAWFQFGTSSTLSGASSTAMQDVGSGTSSVAFSATLSGLAGNMLYYYRAVASNSGGTVNGSISSFTTSIALTNGYQFIPVTPCRVVDTRNPNGPFGGPELSAGTTRSFAIPQSACGIPSTAVAYSLNVTVLPNASLGYLTLWPSGQPQPLVSTLNSDGRIKANAAITPAGTNGSVSVYVSNATHVILDIDGYFVPAGTASALAFYPLSPCRVADTRDATGSLGGPSLAADSSRAFPVQSSACGIPATAKAYSLNVTTIPHKTLNYLTTWPTGLAQPTVSTLNAPTGTIVANAAIVPAGTSGNISIFVSDAADVILDVNGYFAPPTTGGLSLYTVTPCRVIDTRQLIPPFPGILTVSVEGSPCAPPSTAAAYVLNATVLPAESFTYLTLWPGGESQPVVSTLNALDGAITSNMAIVPTNNGTVDTFGTGTANLILDLSSYFAP